MYRFINAFSTESVRDQLRALARQTLIPADPPEDSLLLGRLGKTFQLAGGLRFYGLGQAEAEAIFRARARFHPRLG